MRLVSGLSGTILSYLYLTKTKRPGETLGIQHSKNVCAGGNPGSSIRLFIYQNGNEYEFQWELWSMQLSYPIIQIDAIFQIWIVVVIPACVYGRVALH